MYFSSRVRPRSIFRAGGGGMGVSCLQTERIFADAMVILLVKSGGMRWRERNRAHQRIEVVKYLAFEAAVWYYMTKKGLMSHTRA